MFANADLVPDVSRSSDIPLLIQVVEAFNNLTSLGIAVQVASDVAI